MEESAIVRGLRRMYDARLAGDVEACLACFAETGVYRMANVCDPHGNPVMANGREELRAALTGLVATWRWVRREEQSLIVQGNVACARYRLQLVHLPTGEEIDTEMMDHITFDAQSKATMFAQFVDTALVARLSA